MALGTKDLFLGLETLRETLPEYKANSYIATTAAVAGGTAIAGYLNAKYHIGNDLKTIIRLKRARKDYEKAGSLCPTVLRPNCGKKAS
jgi:hypothetical protein